MSYLNRMRILLFLFMLMLSAQGFAQDGRSVMRENGRIYVVVAVMVTILAGLIIYMVRVDRKLTRIEKETGNKP